jgi:hypothetical protein
MSFFYVPSKSCVTSFESVIPGFRDLLACPGTICNAISIERARETTEAPKVTWFGYGNIDALTPYWWEWTGGEASSESPVTDQYLAF